MDRGGDAGLIWRAATTALEWPAMTVLYFAYGSNMLAERIVRRCASARVIGRATLPAHTVAFSKIGRDGTGKATLVAAGDAATAHGVVFEMSRDDIATLDRIEGRGRGYHRIERASLNLSVCGSLTEATTYIAEPRHIDPDLVPFDWYRNLVLAGAVSHGLPQEYCAWLKAHPVRADDDAQRATRLEALDILAAVPGLLSGPG